MRPLGHSATKTPAASALPLTFMARVSGKALGGPKIESLLAE
jgi:hypothetical protein